MTTLSFTFSRPPPSINAQKAAVLHRGAPRLIKTEPYRSWMKSTSQELMTQPGFGGEFLWSSLILFPCNVSRMDVDNAPKALHDALVSAGKVPDDRYLVETCIRWAEGDNVVVTVKSEGFLKWSRVKRFSPALTRRLGGN